MADDRIVETLRRRVLSGCNDSLSRARIARIAANALRPRTPSPAAATHPRTWGCASAAPAVAGIDFPAGPLQASSELRHPQSFHLLEALTVDAGAPAVLPYFFPGPPQYIDPAHPIE